MPESEGRRNVERLSRDLLAQQQLPREELRVIAWERKESEPCQAGTPGCAIEHARDSGGCETW